MARTNLDKIKLPKTSKRKWWVFLVVIVIFGLSAIAGTFAQEQDKEIFWLKLRMMKPAKAERYQARLELYRIAVSRGDWPAASTLEKGLDKEDASLARADYDPEVIKGNINILVTKTNKSTEDLIEIARLYTRIKDKDQAKKYLQLAQEKDPTRNEISQMIQELSNN